MPSEERLAEAERQIRKRLSGVCSHLTAADFEELVHKIALNEVKSEKGTPGGFVWKSEPEKE